jgi:phosphoribosylformylglycinamidine (FGAM) synthase PurS component
MGPIDYIGQVRDPFASTVQGYQLGAGIQQLEQQKQAQALALQQQQREMERQKQIQDAGAALMRNPNPSARDFINLASMLPEKEAASMRANWDALSKDRKDSELSFTTQVLAAVNSAKPEIGIQLLRDRAEAEADPAKKKAFETYAKIAEVDPKAAFKTIGLSIAAIPEGAGVIEGLTRLGGEERAIAEEGRKAELQTLEVQQRQATIGKTTAEAQSAATAAKFAESKAVMDLKMGEAQIKALAEDAAIKRQNVAIAAMNARTAAAGNDIQRQKLGLDLQQMIDKRDSAVREKAAEVESARFNIDNMLNTADRVLNTPMSVIGSAAGPLSNRIPTTFQSTADFEALVETLGSQAFLSQLPNIKGMGQLSNAEGDKLQAALQNLSLKQSPERLVENVREAQRLLLKVRKNVGQRFGVPETVPGTPAATTARSASGKVMTTDEILKDLKVFP